jgi:L-alanine-DL-glutamate epimerase-like enolase superfamily enzyme
VKIVKVETFDVRWPFDRVRSDAVNLTDAWGFAVVRLTCEDGTVGTGYTGTARGVGNSLILAAIQENYAPVLLGSEATNIRGLWKKMYWSPLHWCGRSGVSQMALAAVDIALWDIAARLADLPLCDYLGAQEATAFAAYNTNGGWSSFTLDELVENAKESVEAGFRGVKIKLGLRDGSEDLRRVAAVRDEVGDSIDIMTDVNQAWGIPDAFRWGPRLADYGVKWLEEPMDPDDWRAHARLAGAIATPVALGEHLYNAHAFDDFISANAVFYVQADATRVGGITEFLQIADLAAVRGLPLCPHAGDMMQVHQHLIFVAPTAHVFEHIPWGSELFIDPAVVRDGKVQRPTAPGAGTAMYDEMIARYLVGRPGVSAP